MSDIIFEKDWYFQGFNGVPSMLYGPAFSMLRDMPDFLGYGYTACVIYFNNGVSYYLYDWEDLHNILEVLLKKYHDDPAYLDYLLKSDISIRDYVMGEYKKISINSLGEIGTSSLFILWVKVNNLYAHLLSVSHIVEGFTLTTENSIREFVKNEFPDEYVKKIDLLTTPFERSFVATEQYHIAKIAEVIKNNGLDFIDDKILINFPNISIDIDNHQRNYYWKLNSYTSAKILSKDYFIKEINSLLASGNFLKVIKDYELFDKIWDEKLNCLKNIKNNELIDLLNISDTLFKIHDKRKECMIQAVHYLDFILIEIAKRFDISIEIMRYIRPSELEFLPNIKKELEARKNGSLFILNYNENGGVEDKFLSGNQAREMWEKIKSSPDDHGLKELSGNCASLGKVIGTVKVCRGEDEIGKVKKGDILVACMTQPEFIPAMRLAGAIVTDEGGLTCHAAIVSRELGIPCIIGTKIATKVFKDGDMVEVDANSGVVRKV